MKKISVISLGCPKNLVDTEKYISNYYKGSQIVSPEEDSDLCHVATCAFIKDARDESYAELKKQVKKLNAGSIGELSISGCLVDLEGDKLEKQFPGAKVISYSKCLLENKSRSVLSTCNYAYLKISEGCNAKCTFCLIPKIKGRFKPFNVGKLLKEAEYLSKAGIKELIIVSQCTNQTKAKTLRKLISSILHNCSFRWIRIMYMNPDFWTDDFLEVYSQSPRVLKYFDLPLQHVDENILSLMGRRQKSSFFISMIDKIRKTFAGSVIRSSFIAGFPDETDISFQKLADFVSSGIVDYAGIFKYSPHLMLESEKNDGKISASVMNKRYFRLRREAAKALSRFNNKWVNRKCDAMIYSVSGDSDYLVARTWFQTPDIDPVTYIPKPAIFKSRFPVFKTIEISSSKCPDLIGAII